MVFFKLSEAEITEYIYIPEQKGLLVEFIEYEEMFVNSKPKWRYKLKVLDEREDGKYKDLHLSAGVFATENNVKEVKQMLRALGLESEIDRVVAGSEPVGGTVLVDTVVQDINWQEVTPEERESDPDGRYFSHVKFMSWRAFNPNTNTTETAKPKKAAF